MKKLTMLFGLAAGLAAAQTTTYSIPQPTLPDGSINPDAITCNTGIYSNPAAVEGCYMHNLQPVPPADGSALPAWALPYAWVNFGGYYAQIDFQQFRGQNAAYSAAYCEGNAVWQRSTLPNGDTRYVMDCVTNTTTSNIGGLMLIIHEEFSGHEFTVTHPCGGGKGSRGTCSYYDWSIYDGFVNLTQVQ